MADITELLRACLRLIALPTRDRVDRPSLPPLWRVPDALARIRNLLPGVAGGAAPLVHFVPRAGERARTPSQGRVARASTLVAALELGRDGVLSLEQGSAFGAIATRSAGSLMASKALGSVHAEMSRYATALPDAEVA